MPAIVGSVHLLSTTIALAASTTAAVAASARHHRPSAPSLPSFSSTVVAATMDSSVSTVDVRSSYYAVVSDKLVAGGFAGATARTIVAPFDRLKMLMQTQRPAAAAAKSSSSSSTPPLRAATTAVPSVTSPSTATLASPSPSAVKYTSTLQGLRTIVHEEGLLALWKGNLINVMRVFPYSAVQFGSYDVFKHAITALSNNNSNSSSSPTVSLSPWARLTCGALAGVCATTLTHPMDVLRLRVSVQRDVHTLRDAARQLWHEGGARALFKGYVPTLLSVCPFIAVNFACFDSLKSLAFVQPYTSSVACTMLLGATSAMIAQSACYPLDTVRRHMQMPGASAATSTLQAMRTIVEQQGVRALYAGIVPNAVKVVPANAMRFFVFDTIQKYLHGDELSLASSFSLSTSSSSSSSSAASSSSFM